MNDVSILIQISSCAQWDPLILWIPPLHLTIIYLYDILDLNMLPGKLIRYMKNSSLTAKSDFSNIFQITGLDSGTFIGTAVSILYTLFNDIASPSNN